MYKQQFLSELEKKLGGLPQEDIHERLNFYDESISDRMEEGLTEEEAVAAIGNADAIAAQIIAETPFARIAKVRLNSGDAKQADNARKVLVYVLDQALRLLHPFMPFVTEKLYQALPGSAETIMLQDWPVYTEAFNFAKEESDFEKIVALIKAVRTVRTDMNVHPTKRTHFIIETATPDAFASGIAFLEKFAFATEVTLVDKFEGDTNGMVQVITETARAFMPLMELIDRDKELARLNKELEACEKNIASINAKVGNENFVAKAPEKVVNDMREKLAAALQKKAGIEESIAALG